ncbi:unnamed protein product, partial [Gulo gulo]
MEGDSVGVSVAMTTGRTELPSLLAFCLGPPAHPDALHPFCKCKEPLSFKALHQNKRQ